MPPGRGQARVSITSDTSDLERGVDRAGRALDRLGREGVSNVSGASRGLTANVGGVTGSLGALAAAATAVGPVLIGAGAAATALAGSFAAATAGAGALGIGLGAALGPVAVVAAGVKGRLEAVTKAYEALKVARQQDTAAAREAAAEALEGLSTAERGMVTALGRLSGIRERVLGGAQDAVFVGLAKAITSVTPMLERLAGPFTKLGQAMGDALARIGRELGNSTWTTAFRQFIDLGRQMVKPLTDVALAVGNVLRMIAQSAGPMAVEIFKDMAASVSAWASSLTQSGVEGAIQGLVSHTRDWWELIKAVGRLLTTVFSTGASEGQNLVQSLTQMTNQFNRFLSSAEGQQRLNKLFRDSVTVIGMVASALGKVAAWAPKIIAVGDAIMHPTKAAINLGQVLGGTLRRAFASMADFALGAISSILDGFANVISVGGKIPGIGGKFKNLADDVRGAANSVNSLRDQINGLPSKKVVRVEIHNIQVGKPSPHIPLPGRGLEPGVPRQKKSVDLSAPSAWSSRTLSSGEPRTVTFDGDSESALTVPDAYKQRNADLLAALTAATIEQNNILRAIHATGQTQIRLWQPGNVADHVNSRLGQSIGQGRAALMSPAGHFSRV